MLKIAPKGRRLKPTAFWNSLFLLVEQALVSERECSAPARKKPEKVLTNPQPQLMMVCSQLIHMARVRRSQLALFTLKWTGRFFNDPP